MLSAAQTQVMTSSLIMMRSFHPFCRCKPAPESPCDSLAHVHLLTAPEEGGCPASAPQSLFIHSLASSLLTPLAPQHLPRPSHSSQPWQLLLLSTVLSFTKPRTSASKRQGLLALMVFSVGPASTLQLSIRQAVMSPVPTVCVLAS